MEKIKRVLNFYVLVTSLKDKIRSSAEHIYGTCMLAIAMDSEYFLI